MATDSRSNPAATVVDVYRDKRSLRREHVAYAPVLVVPIEACVIGLASSAASARLDRAKIALVPPNVAYAIEVESPVVNVVLVAVGRAALDTFFQEYGADVNREVWADVLSKPRVFPRTRWVDELCHRYVFERTVCAKERSLAARFLEVELVKECYFLGKETLSERTRDAVTATEDPLVARVRAHIDAHLFEDVSLADLCSRFGTSESTLLRTFRRVLGTTPAEYTRSRRLDEARILLESGTSSASEIAHHVGYGSLPAFTAAFTRKFGHAPSAARKKTHLVRLPPHGEAPVRRPRTKD